MQQSLQSDRLIQAVLTLEDRGYCFRATQLKDRQEILIREGDRTPANDYLVKFVKDNKRETIDYLQMRARYHLINIRYVLGVDRG